MQKHITYSWRGTGSMSLTLSIDGKPKGIRFDGGKERPKTNSSYETSDELRTIAKWKDTGGAEKIVALSKIKKDMPEIYEYMKEKELLEFQKTDRKPEIKLKLED